MFFFIGSLFLSRLVSASPLSFISNETRHIKWHETCRCIFRLDAIVCDNR